MKLSLKKSRKSPESLLTPAFLVEFDSTVAVKEVPTTGMEFLQKMISEREACPHLAVQEYESRQTLFFKELPAPASAPPTLKPTIEWQTQQVTDFYDNRIQVIARSLSEPPTCPTQLNKYDDEEELLSLDFRTQQPDLKLMLQLKQDHLDTLLEYILGDILDNVCPGEGIDRPICEWIYAILVRQSNPVLSKSCSIMRSLARKCAEIRSHLSPDDSNAFELAVPLNLFICIVARYYRELDLAD